MPGLPKIAIVGRPNVGKSTLFNRICGRRRALVGNEPGMTRDRLYAPAEWLGKRFDVVDTGGMVPAEKELIASEIYRQARVATDEAAHLVLVVDGRAGVAPLDEELAQLLRRSGKPLSLAVNKVDSIDQSALGGEFHRLGIRDIFPVSAEHGLGIDDLLDHVTAGIEASPVSPADLEPEPRRRARRVEPSPEPPADEAEAASEAEMGAAPGETSTPSLPHGIRVAIIGRPNVG
ncbi:MAG TPA: GTPase, partial [Terriglobia bacterium]|nr:GTPase [Terriglobia bacterium]